MLQGDINDDSNQKYQCHGEREKLNEKSYFIPICFLP